MKYRTDYRVEGSGEFPFDMLRYDCSFPATEPESGKLHSHRRDHRHVLLSKYHSDKIPLICEPRWQSFGWRVVEIVQTVKRGAP